MEVIDLGVYCENGMAIFQIEDTGPGVPGSDLDRIFEPFFRGRAGGDGSGLGLSIVKRTIDEAGGSIVAENIVGADRSGLRVTIKLRARDT